MTIRADQHYWGVLNPRIFNGLDALNLGRNYCHRDVMDAAYSKTEQLAAFYYRHGYSPQALQADFGSLVARPSPLWWDAKHNVYSAILRLHHARDLFIAGGDSL